MRGVVVVAGPDGSGKSTLVRAIREEAARQGGKVCHVNFRERILDRAAVWRRGAPADIAAHVRPHATRQQPPVVALLKTAFLYLDLAASAIKWVLLARRGQRFLVERYCYDLIVDPARLGVTRAPLRARTAFVRRLPKPRAVLLCEVDPELAFARKGELAIQEIRSQYATWGRPGVLPDDVPLIRVDTSAAVDVSVLMRVLA